MRAVAPRGAVRVLVVGLGRAASLSLSALNELGCELVGGVDPAGAGAGAALPDGFPVHRSLDELPGSCEADVVVVATPTPSHVEVCRRLLELRVAPRVLCEKPLGESFESVRAVFLAAVERDVRLEVLFHYAFAPEVLAVGSAWPSLVADHGPPLTFEASFEDPRGDDLERSVRVLGSSWVDLGVNAISVLARFVDLVGVEDVLDDSPWSGGATLRFSGGTGTVRTKWGRQEVVKRTAIDFADGTTVRLDHTEQRAVMGRGEADVLCERVDEDVAAARYRRMLAAHLEDEALVYDGETTLKIHRLLADGARKGPG